MFHIIKVNVPNARDEDNDTNSSSKYLLCPQERWRSIVISMSVCMSVCVCVSVCVCLSASISPEPQAWSLPNFLFMLPITVARSSSGGVTHAQGEGAILGDFFPTDNALYSIAFRIHTKTAEPIEMPFGLMTQVGSSIMCYMGDSIAHG